MQMAFKVCRPSVDAGLIVSAVSDTLCNFSTPNANFVAPLVLTDSVGFASEVISEAQKASMSFDRTDMLPRH